MTKGTQVTGLLAALLAIAGCGGVTADDRYGSAEDLQSALESEGFRCSTEESFDLFEGYGEEVRCTSGMSVVVWDQDMPEYADDVSMLRLGASLGGREYLGSENWMIIHDNSQMLDEIQEVFGGER